MQTAGNPLDDRTHPPAGSPPGSPDGPLVGRTRELRVLEQMLDRLAAGAAQVTAVTGEPGIGKTRLLIELGRLAGRRSVPVAAGRAPEPARRVPFGALVDALDDHLAGLDHACLAPLGAERLGLLGRVFPALSGGAPAPPGGAGADPGERYHLYRAVRALLEELARPGLVLVLDDLHAADGESIDLLTHLVRRPSRAPVLLALAYRPRQACGRLRTAVEAAAAQRLDLGPLSEHDVDALLGPCDDRSRRRALYVETGGNPFYLEALVRSAPGRRSGGARGDGDLPPAVEAALLAEVDGLSDPAKLLARAGAVAGDRFEARFAAEIAELAGPGALAALDELVDRDVVRPLADTRRFAYRHALVRRVIYDSAPPGWRLAAHARAAEALRRRGGSVVDRAHHLELIARPGDLAAVAALADAARAVGQRAPAVAVRWQRAALDLLPDAPDALPRRVMLLFDLAVCLGAAGRPRESRDTLHEVLRLLPRDKVGLRANAVAFCAQMERLLRQRAPGHALLVRTVATLPDQDSAEAATLRFELACGELFDGRPVPARGLAEQALTAAGRLGAQPLQAATLGVLAVAHLFTGDAPAAQARLGRATALVDGMLDSELAARLDAAIWVGWSELFLDRLPDALRHFDRALELTRTGAHPVVGPDLVLGRALALRAAGRLPEAAAAADDAVDRSGSGERHALAVAVQRWIATMRGGSDRVSRAHAAVRPGDAAVGGWLSGFTSRMLAETRLAVGDWKGCLAVADSVGGPQAGGRDLWSRADWYEVLTRAELAAGRIDAALASAAWAEKAAAAAGAQRRAGALALLARAQADSAREPGSGLAPAVQARDALRSLGMIFDAARAQVVAGLALGVRGECDLAEAELAAAQAAFEACGALLPARRTAAERRRTSGPVPRPSAGPDRGGLNALTRRERQIAGLVTEGLTNRLIAQRLSVAEKTVEMHLSNVFAKLDVSSRTALASWVIRSAAAPALATG